MSSTNPEGFPAEYEEPERAAHPSALAPLPAAVQVPATPQALANPGWYAEPGKPGVLRYWNGTSWEDWRKPLVEAPSVGQGQKSVAVAYVLAILLGMTGAHNFYLGRIGPAVGMLALWLLGILTSIVFIGGLFLLAVGIWLIIDLVLIPGFVRTASLRAVGRSF